MVLLSTNKILKYSPKKVPKVSFALNVKTITSLKMVKWLRGLHHSKFKCWKDDSGCWWRVVSVGSKRDAECRRTAEVTKKEGVASCQELDSRKSLQCRAFLSFASLSIHSENITPPRNDCQTFFITYKFVSKKISLFIHFEAQSTLNASFSSMNCEDLYELQYSVYCYSMKDLN